jgi:multisubunit Na+/H+ antiporter MnhC subunit
MPLETIVVLSAIVSAFGFFAFVLEFACRQSAQARAEKAARHSLLQPAE